MQFNSAQSQDTVDTIIFEGYDEVRKAFYSRDLSRNFDDRSFDEGNPRADVLSVLHGQEHKLRRRLETPLFRRDALVQYEQILFPEILQNLLWGLENGPIDLFHLSGKLSVVLAARRAGIDHDGSMQQLGILWENALEFSRASSILDNVGDYHHKKSIQDKVIQSLHDFDVEFVTPSRQRRQILLNGEHGSATDPSIETPHDLITAVLENRNSDGPLVDDSVLVREIALYLHGGSHTSAHTVCNTFYYLLGLEDGERKTSLLHRVAEDLSFAQKAVHEALRLRPPGPRAKRRAVVDCEVNGVEIPKDSMVILDLRSANRDPDVFGERPEEFDPERTLAPNVPLWGLTFGAGPHICIGRSVAGGFPVQSETEGTEPGEEHLFGLVAKIVRAIANRGIELDPADEPRLNTQTDRGTRWATFPVVLGDC